MVLVLGILLTRNSPRMSNDNLAKGLKKVIAINNAQAEFPDHDLIAVPKGETYTPAPPADHKFPQHLLKPGGIMQEMCDWVNESAYMRQPILTLANVLAFWGTVIGRKVCTPSDLRSNFYILGVAVSGAGKDNSRKCIKRICEASGAMSLLGGEEFSSDSAILGAVTKNPSSLFQLDEIGHLLDVTTSNNAPAYLRGIPVMLTKLFSSASTTYLGREYADPSRVRADIVQPNACLYGTTVPERLYDAIGPSEIRDGFLGRMLVFSSETMDPIPNDDVVKLDVPRNIICAVKEWQERTNRSMGDLGDYMDNVPEVVPMDDQAKALLKEFTAECINEKQWNRDGSGLDALYARGPEHAKKIALAVACSISFNTPIIDASAAKYGIDMARYCIGNMCEMARDHVSDTPFGKDELKILRIIKKSGGRGMTKTELCRKTQGMKGKQRNEVTESLRDSEMIEKMEVETGQPGKNKSVWIAR